MAFLVALALVGLVGAIWLRSAKRARAEWLRTLNLVGRWERAGADQNKPQSLTLTGNLTAGEYMAQDGGASERGHWRLRNHTLTLTPASGHPVAFELRLFAPGKIGLDGPGREREIYLRHKDNVIALDARR